MKIIITHKNDLLEIFSEEDFKSASFHPSQLEIEPDNFLQGSYSSKRTLIDALVKASKDWYNIEDSWKFPKENAEFYEKNKDEFGLLFDDEDVFPEHVEDNDNYTAFENGNMFVGRRRIYGRGCRKRRLSERLQYGSGKIRFQQKYCS